MVDVQVGSLCALKQDALALVLRVMKMAHCIADEGCQSLGERLCPGHERVIRDGVGLVPVAEDAVLLGQSTLDVATEAREVEECASADTPPSDLVLIGRTDALLCRADLCPTECLLA